jgi:orotate phosphoribosyltransferase
MKFKEIIDDISYTFETGSVKPQGMRLSKEEEEKRITTIREVILYGSKARGAGYRVRKALQDKFDFIIVASPDQEVPESDKPIVLYIDLAKIDNVPDRLKEYAEEHDNVSMLVIDVNRKEKHVIGFSYTIDANYFIPGFEKDIDPTISEIVSGLYLNVYHAVDEDGVEIPGKGLVKLFFRTSILIDWNRTRDILEGCITSVVRKFDPDVIASRETVGVAPEGVRMYELAKPIAERLGIGSAMITKPSGDYIVGGKDNYIVKDKRVLLLEDVVGDAATKIKIIKATRAVGGIIDACVVLLDKNEGGREALKKEGVELYSLTDLATYEKLAAERKAMLETAK